MKQPCALIGISRSSWFGPASSEPPLNLALMKLMTKMVLRPVYQMPCTTVPHPEHLKYPSLLRNLVIDRPNQIWCADITDIPMQRGFL